MCRNRKAKWFWARPHAFVRVWFPLAPQLPSLNLSRTSLLLSAYRACHFGPVSRIISKNASLVFSPQVGRQVETGQSVKTRLPWRLKAGFSGGRIRERGFEEARKKGPGGIHS